MKGGCDPKGLVIYITCLALPAAVLCSAGYMDLDQIRQVLASYPGTRLFEANNDTFAVHDPGEDRPPERQLPWATIVTSDDAYDSASDLNRPEVFRLNIGLPPGAVPRVGRSFGRARPDRY